MNYIYVDAQSRDAMHCGQMKMKMLTLASGLIASVLVLSFMLKVPQVHAQTSCNYYASPSGRGNGLSSSSPFQIANFWSVASPGETLCLLDGTYTDSTSMLQVPLSVVGTSGSPITIRALNEGKVLIDGQNGSRPGDIHGSFMVIEGINFTRGDNVTFAIRGSNNIARRIIAYDAGDNDGNLGDTNIQIAGGVFNNVIEDCAAFGKGRKQISLTQGGVGSNTIRRCWARWEDNQHYGGDPTITYELGYGQDGATFENILGTWDAASGGRVTEPEGLGEIFRTQNSQWLGSVFYVPAGVTWNPGVLLAGYDDAGSPPQSGDFHSAQNVLIKHIVSFIDPRHPGFGSTSAFSFSDNYQGGLNNRVQDSVGIAGRASSFSGAWVPTNVRTGTSLNAAIGAGNTIWTVVPGVCKRYINRTLTTEPLWPWPMNQRIKDALVQSGRVPVDVTQTMESMLGPIPQACKAGAPDTEITPSPRNLHVISVQ
jgi:chondroitinase B-like protein